MTTYEDEEWWRCWGAYLDHVQPTDGAPMCSECVAAPTMNDGCQEGRRLAGAYRLARIGRGTGEGLKGSQAAT